MNNIKEVFVAGKKWGIGSVIVMSLLVLIYAYHSVDCFGCSGDDMAKELAPIGYYATKIVNTTAVAFFPLGFLDQNIDIFFGRGIFSIMGLIVVVGHLAYYFLIGVLIKLVMTNLTYRLRNI